MRRDGRADDELRPVTFERDYTEMADGSCLFTFGRTKVLCTASVDDNVPRWLRGSGKGWVSAEYSMLPGASPERVDREAAKGKQSGRTVEIQRLIGRSLRAACDLTLLAERQVVVDCDVLQADGGTRTASVTAGYVALAEALAKLVLIGDLPRLPLLEPVAAVSVGVVRGAPVLDLDYSEDQEAEVDMNVVATGSGQLVEVQGTGEKRGFARRELDSLLDLAFAGIEQLLAAQQQALAPLLAEVEQVLARPRGKREPKRERDLWGPPPDRS